MAVSIAEEKMAMDRRSLLRGMLHGTAAAVSIPFLDCFLDTNGAALAATGAALPTRFGTFFYGLGLTKQLWVPDKVGAGYDLKHQLEPLAAHKNKISVFSGFRVPVDNNQNHQHWSGTAGSSTGIAPPTTGVYEGPTIDVTVADAIAKGTRFRSLGVACNGSARTSYSSLGGRNTNPPETSPMALYSRLFGDGFQDPRKGEWKPDAEALVTKSVLSVVADDRKSLVRDVGVADRARLDQYFTSVREVENQLASQLQRPEVSEACVIPNRPEELGLNNAVPNLQKSTELYAKLLALALSCNQTRVFTMAYSDGASGAFLPGDAQPAHLQSHEEADDAALGYQKMTARFGRYSMEAFAHLLSELDAVKEGDGTLLDRSLVFAFTDSSSARIHAIDGIPIFLAGSAGGKLKTGMHVAGAGAAVTRVGLTAQQALGMPVDSWGKNSLHTDSAISEIMV
jgi:hypothetical protein